MKNTERRFFDRRMSEDDIQWAYFNTELFRPGAVVNYCKGGILFQSTYYIHPGTCITVKSEIGVKTAYGKVYEGFPNNKIGLVKWCREKMVNNSLMYDIGIQYQGLFDY